VVSSATAAPPGGTLSELAAQLGRSEEATLELLRPFLAAGIVAEHAGRLNVADRQVLAAFATGQAEEAAA
jgi:hypothetical protein